MSIYHDTRTGPIGRLARLVLLAVAVLTLASIVDQGGVVGFRKPSVFDEPGPWILTAATVVLFIHLVGELARAASGDRAVVRSRVVVSAGLAAALALAAAAGQLEAGAAWGFPLSDLVWWFNASILVETIVALALAIVVGTPGCEIGVWTQLIYRARGERARTAPWVLCLFGLNVVDEWEARRGEQSEVNPT